MVWAISTGSGRLVQETTLPRTRTAMATILSANQPRGDEHKTPRLRDLQGQLRTAERALSSFPAEAQVFTWTGQAIEAKRARLEQAVVALRNELGEDAPSPRRSHGAPRRWRRSVRAWNGRS